MSLIDPLQKCDERSVKFERHVRDSQAKGMIDICGAGSGGGDPKESKPMRPIAEDCRPITTAMQAT
jgi:hypothetical protein